MPLKDALQKPDNIGEMITPSTASTPLPPAPALTPREQPGLAPGSLGPTPSVFTTEYDRVRQWYRPGTSQNRFPPLPLKVNPQLGAIAKSNSTTVAATASDDDNTVLDGITHGTVPWWSDPGFITWREDFISGALPTIFPAASSSSGLAFAGDWISFGTATNRLTLGGNPPHAGIFAWTNPSTSSGFSGIALNTTGDAGGSTNLTFRTMALLENPGWEMEWVFQFLGKADNSTTPDWTKKSLYIGLVGPGIAAVQPNNSAMGFGNSARPDCFFGLRYDTSHTPESWGLTSVAAASGGNTVYTPHAGSTGGLYSSGTNTYLNCTIKVVGCGHGVNNGTFTCTGSTSTTITLNNASGVSESAPSTAVMYPTNLNITAVTQNAPASGKAEYTFPTHVSLTGTAGTNGGYIGQSVTITGCTNAANNGTFTVIGSWISAGNTVIVVANANAVTEVPTANAAFVAFPDPINDFNGNFKFEYVNNGQYNAKIRHNVAGTVVDTGIKPNFNDWYRLKMTCSVAGTVLMSLLDENAATIFSSTFVIPKMSIIAFSSYTFAFDVNGQMILSVTSSTSGVNTTPTIPFPQFGTGALITLSGLTGGLAGLNGNYTLFLNGSTSLNSWIGIINTSAASGVGSATLSGYPSLTPMAIWGCDDSGANSSFPPQSVFGIDLFAFTWNTNLGPNAPGTPNVNKSRYW